MCIINRPKVCESSIVGPIILRLAIIRVSIMNVICMMRELEFLEKHEIPILAYSRPNNLADDSVRARLKGKGDEEMENTHLENENSPSQTLEVLQYLEQESRGFNDYYTFKYVYSDDEESCDIVHQMSMQD